MTPPIAFFSYSHDSQSHKAWVQDLAARLRANGIDAILDQWDLSPGQDVAAFMESSIAKADRVLVVCTETYTEKADGGAGGVGYERLVITGELVAKIDTKKFLPLVRQASDPRRLPHFLGSRLYIDFSQDADFDARADELLRELHGAPRTTKPLIGPNPFAGIAPQAPPQPRVATLSGMTARGDSIVLEEWFGGHAATANETLMKHGRLGAMEIRAALHEPIAKSQLDLLNAVRKAEIRTFGWPIGILLENRDEYRPRPVTDGIVAEIAVPERSLSGVPSYDYWAARMNGDFYLLQSLFEDERVKDAIFFDTRIVRVTEALLFVAGLYSHLGLAGQSRATVRIAHQGLQGRALRSAGGNRHVWPRQTTAQRSEAQVSDTITGLRENIVDHVTQILDPVFMLFDFAEFNRAVYIDIVTKFAAGHVG